MTTDAQAELSRRIDVIEGAYEFMLSYAAQGREDDFGPGEDVRDFLKGVAEALDGLDAAIAACVEGAEGEAAERWAEFTAITAADAARARAAVRLVMAQPAISSEMIDNLNASIHVRTLLTDLFLVDEAVKKTAAG